MSSPEPAPHQAASALSVKARPGCANFTSDNTAGCLPEVLAAVSAAAAGTAPAYGNDEHTRTLDGAFERVLVTGPRSLCATGGGNTDDPCATILAFESTKPELAPWDRFLITDICCFLWHADAGPVSTGSSLSRRWSTLDDE